MASTAWVESRNASTAASCVNSAAQVKVFSTRRQPVMAKLFENPSIITVRPAMPGSAQID